VTWKKTGHVPKELQAKHVELDPFGKIVQNSSEKVNPDLGTLNLVVIVIKE
jgi:hypothetical protein